MNCRHVEPLLSNDLEGRLSKRRGEAIATHLQGCPECRRLHDEILAVGDELRSVAAPLPPADLRRRVADRWTAERVRTASCGRRGFLEMTPCSKGTRTARRWTLGASALAAALLMFLLPELVRWQGDRSAPPHGPRITWQPRDVPIPPEPRGPQPRPLKDPGQQRHPDARTQAGHRDKLDGAPSGRIRSPGPGSHSFRPDGSRPVPPAPADDHPRNASSMREARRSHPLPADAWDAFEERVRRHVRVRDDFVRISFPRIASTSDRQIAEAVESYKREAAIVDTHLTHEVTLQQKASALSDLCDRLRGDTGIRIEAGPSVADEKVTILCEKMPLREVMRQLSRPFGYTWLRSGKTGEYKYELVQDLRSQLLEEELRNRDRNAALLALEREIDRYRPYLDLSPDEALARAKTAPAGEKAILEALSGTGWGPIHMYFRLSPQEMATLRAGRTLTFSAEPYSAEQPLPTDLSRGVLQSLRQDRFIKRGDQYAGANPSDPSSLPLTTLPEAQSVVTLAFTQSELGRFTLTGNSGFRMAGTRATSLRSQGPCAVGLSPAVLNPDNREANAQMAHDPTLGSRVTLRPVGHCQWAVAASGTENGSTSTAAKKTTSADVLEALHRTTGLPIVADFYTRLYQPEAVSVSNQPLFETLNLLGDAMHEHWHKDAGTREAGAWLRFRSASFYDDRLKEVPNRFLSRWAATRQTHGFLPLDVVLEMVQLPDVQLDAAEMAEGVRECWGLPEWDMARRKYPRPHLRFLASLTPAQRQETMSAAGLPLTKMSLAQQQRFLSLGPREDESLEELAGATLRVAYLKSGTFQLEVPGMSHGRPGGPAVRQPIELALVQEPTREAALQAARQLNPAVDASQIIPTEPAVIIIYTLRDPRTGLRSSTVRSSPSGSSSW